MHWGWSGQYGMGFGFGGIFMILLWVLIILGIVYLAKILLGSTPAEKEKMESAEEVLRKRYARGEIGREEFEETLEVLRKHGE